MEAQASADMDKPQACPKGGDPGGERRQVEWLARRATEPGGIGVKTRKP